ncbi:YjjG family noncanonical pyrimidine nucleotidase [Streptococcus sp. DD12]|uniref:YjjG family noncanonical pyrimidine nucleotidase n=1 Tax=Streptococcus sp. DD12 TaxID=1777880 RepID=UPI000796A46A|nr:YjjG family noncanonical pyrimidine nucleotidase [Streptococcus sp. DD12]KXT76654.1 2-haloalkanoic acid dehalogenase [Streptococcus sp. DD12]
MSYKFLLFDLDRTLLDFDTAEDKALDQLFGQEGVADIQAFKSYYIPLNEQLWKAHEREEISKDTLVKTRFSRTFAHFGLERNGEDLAKRYQELLSQQGQVFPGAITLLETLRKGGYELYAITNGITAIQKGRLTVSSLAPYFKKVFISEQMGTQKPSRTFFDLVARAIPGYDATQALVIGDSLTSDIQGAVNAGLTCLWYNPKGLALDKDDPQPTAVVKDFDDVLTFLSARKDK